MAGGRRVDLAHVNGGRLSGVAGVLLECEPQDGDLLAGYGVEHSIDDTLHKPLLLVVVDGHNLAIRKTLSYRH